MADKNRIGKRPPTPNAPATPIQRVLNEPSTYRLAFYRGTRAQQRKAIEELQEGVERAGRKVITFNCQRYARQERIWHLLVQSLVLRTQDLLADHLDLESKVEGLLGSLDEFIDGQLSQSRKVRLLETLDHELEHLLKVALPKPPLVVVIKGLGTLEPRALVELVEFISGSLEIRRLCFVMGLRESAVSKGLDDHYRGESPLTAQEFLEESFPILIPLGPPEPESPRDSKTVPAERGLDELPPALHLAPTPAMPGGHPEQGFTGNLISIYPDPMLREKLVNLQNLAPQVFWALDRDPALLLALERLTRGDQSPAVQHQLATNELLRSAFAEPPIRAVLVKPPYFDPTPVELDRMGSVAGLRMVSDGPSFDVSPPERRGLESENGSSIQARIKHTGGDPRLEDLGEPRLPPPPPPASQPQPAVPRPMAAKTAKKKIVAKKIKSKPGARSQPGVKGKPRQVNGPEKRVKGPRTTRSPVTKSSPAKASLAKAPVAKPHRERAPNRPEPRPARDPPPPAVELADEGPQDPVQDFLTVVEAGDIQAVRELAGRTLGSLNRDELEKLVQALFKLTQEGSNRVMAAAAFTLGLLGRRVSGRTAQMIKDRLLTLTGQSHREVREEAAQALSAFKKGMTSPPPPPPPPAGAFKTVPDEGQETGKRPTFGVVSGPPARERPASFAIVDEPTRPKASAPSFAVVKDNEGTAPPERPGGGAAFAVVGDDDKTAPPRVPPPPSPPGGRPGFSVVKDDKTPTKVPAPSFAVVKDDPPRASAPSFAVVREDDPADRQGGTSALPRPLGQTSGFKVVGEEGSPAPTPSPPDGSGTKKPAKKGFQVVN